MFYCKWLASINTLAYDSAELSTAVESFTLFSNTCENLATYTLREATL